MVNTPARPGPFDPLGDADPEVPFFPLMGTDPLAPGLVLEWADLARKRARETDERKERRRLQEKALEAEEIAWAMQRYYRTGSADNVRAANTRANYNDEAREDHRWKSLVLGGCAALRDAAAQLNDATGFLPDDQAEALRAAVAVINAIASDYQPKRASFADEPRFPTMAGAG